MSERKLSIVIPVFNKSAFTKKTLNDLAYLDGNAEIIVIDNASTDETNGLLTICPNKNMSFITNETNQGFGKACNKGYGVSTGDIVMFLNNDIRIEDKKTWIQPIIDELEKHPDAIVSPTAGFVDPKRDFQFVYETTDANKPFNYLSGWCIAARREIWAKLTLQQSSGPFDESFFLYYEDSDLGMRAKALDIPMRLVRLSVKHFGKVSSAQLNTFKWYNTSRQIFLNKWKGKV